MAEQEKTAIEELFERPFSARSFEEKREIIGKRPCPQLPNLVMKHSVKKTNCKDYTRHFSVTQYEKTIWLAGCSKKNKLFCWPCLLFKTEAVKNVWNHDGFSDLNHLSAALQKHERSQNHAACFLKFTLFGKQRIDIQLDEQRRDHIRTHNEKVRKNREILKRLIQAVCFLGKQELPFRGHDESADSLNKGNFREYLESVREFDPALDNHLQTSTVFRGTSATIQNDLIKAVNSVMMDEIKQQIDAADFVSIMLDETTDVINKSQLSTVFRYVYQGCTFERFVHFTDVSADRSSEGLFKHVKNVVESFKIGQKLIGQTYDGASVMSGHLTGLQTKVLEEYPNAIFTHCYAHVLNLVLQHSLNSVQECRIFFQTLNGLAAFFSKSTKRTHLLKDYLDKKLPSVAPTRWNFTSRLVHTVHENRVQLYAFFSHCIEDSGNWDHDSSVKFQGFLVFLEKFENVFLLRLFSKIFSYTDVLYDILQTKTFDILYCSRKVADALSAFKEIRESNAFEEFYEWTESQLLSHESSSSDNIHLTRNQQKIDNSIVSKKLTLRRLFYEIIDNVCSQIDARFSSIETLSYFNLLNSEKFSVFKTKFPDSEFEKLKTLYKDVFDFIRLKNELIVVFSSEEFQNKAIHEIVNFMFSNNLNRGLKEVYKLAVLVLTIPSTTASVERSFSALKRIKTYNRSTQQEDRLSGLALMSIEKCILMNLQSNKENFYNLVINKFLEHDRRLEFIYK